ASIDNPEKINVLVYEHRDIYACSIICTIDSLGVYCEIALNDTEFFQKIENNSYSFIFISYALYINAKEKLQELGDKTKIVLLAGFGEMVADTKLKILAMPVHCISVANILNGTGDNSTWGTNLGIYSWFTAPTANVLVVDDINTNLSVVEGLLLPYKMQVDTCESGELALEMVAEKNYDLIFMDHMMPVMDGVEATFRIRKMSEKDPHYKELPIIALTANAVSGSREMFQENGFSDFLSKPIDTIQLNAILEKWIPKEKQIGSAEGAVGETSESLNAVESGGNFEIEGLNAAAGIKIVGGSLKTYLSTLGIFYRDGNKKILEIAKCLEANDLSLYTIFIHALKGACANIGAEKLSGAARILEIAGTKRDLNFVLANNSIFIANLEALLFKINEFLAIKAEESKNIVLDRELLNAGLSGLKTALVSFDSAEIKKAVSVLREFSHAADVGPAVENILRNVLTGDYDEAVELINSIM
ncbi:MAG: response regulator, partial [Treponema sp.]|nr:response regulator [Treponema sp.]